MTKLYLVDEEGKRFMGIGVLWLLERVREHGSLRRAAMSLDLSYSKAFAMVENLERNLDIVVLDRKKGGAQREGATLTAEGARFLELYRLFDAEAKESVEGVFTRFRQEVDSLLDDCRREQEQ